LLWKTIVSGQIPLRLPAAAGAVFPATLGVGTAAPIAAREATVVPACVAAVEAEFEEDWATGASGVVAAVAAIAGVAGTDDAAGLQAATSTRAAFSSSGVEPIHRGAISIEPDLLRELIKGPPPDQC
jgi:hypothetical protein